jgi:hypothetical protein
MQKLLGLRIAADYLVKQAMPSSISIVEIKMSLEFAMI